jgi:outer membrane protein assembly factor BamE (lipoprotein component of BamABCDE complex)
MKKSLALLLVFSALALVTACAPLPASQQGVLGTVVRAPTEALGADVISSNYTTEQITVLGARIGMSETEVIALLGAPDKQQEFDFGAIRNLEYGPSLGLQTSGVLYHFENGLLTRTTVYAPLNEYLIGSTKTGLRNTDVYSALGSPDRQYDYSNGRFFVYNERGIEVYLKDGTVYAYGFVTPNRKLPTTATLEGMTNDPFKPRVPRLITDTTTLCDQGETFAYSVGSGECVRYANACTIPDNWIEVANCDAASLTDEALLNAVEASR